MNPTSRPCDNVFLTAARCADCPDPACMRACPEEIDLRGLFEFIAAQAPIPLMWTRTPGEAAELVREAIQDSYK